MISYKHNIYNLPLIWQSTLNLYGSNWTAKQMVRKPHLNTCIKIHRENDRAQIVTLSHLSLSLVDLLGFLVLHYGLVFIWYCCKINEEGKFLKTVNKSKWNKISGFSPSHFIIIMRHIRVRQTMVTNILSGKITPQNRTCDHVSFSFTLPACLKFCSSANFLHNICATNTSIIINIISIITDATTIIKPLAPPP